MTKKSLAVLLVLCLFVTSIMISSEANDKEVTNSPCGNELPDLSLKGEEKQKEEETRENECTFSDAIALGTHVFDYVDRETFEKNNHIARLESLEDLNTYVFLNANGSKTLYFLDENVKYLDNAGVIHEKDISLTYKNNEFTTKDNNVLLTFHEYSHDGIEISSQMGKLTLKPQTGYSSVAEMNSEDNSITYIDVFGKGISARYKPTLSGVKEEIILSNRDCPTEYTFEISTDLEMFYNENVLYLAENKSSEKRFEIGEVFVFDQKMKSDFGWLNTEKTENGYQITLCINSDFLNREDIVFPVIIDPTISFSDNTSSGMIEDAPVFNGKPSINFGNFSYNRAGYVNSNYGVGRTVVRITGLNNNHIFQEIDPSQICTASFNVFATGGNSNNQVYLAPLLGNSTWTETGITWETMGSSSTAVWLTYFNDGEFASFFIPELVRAWKQNVFDIDSGFVIYGSNENIDESFYSSEYSENTSYRPYFSMTFVDLPTGTYFVKNRSTGLFIKSNNSIAGSDVLQNTISTQNSMRWKFTVCSDGTYTIKNEMSNMYLGISGVNSNSAVVKQYSSLSDNAKWYISKTASNSYSMIAKSNYSYGKAMSSPSSSATSGASVSHLTYTNNSDYRDEWYINLLDYKIEHLYDSTFLNNSELKGNISRTTSLLNKVFKKNFGVTFTSTGTSYMSNASADQCSCGANVPCTSSSCGADCANHHKNVINISNELYDPSLKNTLRALWSDRTENTYCYLEGGVHTTLNALAVVVNYRPVMLFMQIYGDDADVRRACMCINLVHEAAHTFGFDDVYDNPGHDMLFDYVCVMERFDEYFADEFYQHILLYPEDAFCSSCLNSMETVVYNKIND